VGRILLSRPCRSGADVSIGGWAANAPFIVFDDADIDDPPLEGAIACKFRTTAQTCVCRQPIYVAKRRLMTNSRQKS